MIMTSLAFHYLKTVIRFDREYMDYVYHNPCLNSAIASTSSSELAQTEAAW